MRLQKVAIILAVCGALAGLIVASDPAYSFFDWLRFTLVGFAVVYLVTYLRKRKGVDHG